MRPVATLNVQPALPTELEVLRSLAHNLRWSWNAATRELFRRIDADLWEETAHNPVELLAHVSPERLEAAAADEGFRSHLNGVLRASTAYLDPQTTWYARTHGAAGPALVAYFSAEFAVTECLPIFAGGLGVLAGDHLKSASDLGIPLIGVGLLYQQGYFRQYLNEAGWQQEVYAENDFHRMPIEQLRDAAGAPLRVVLAFPGREVQVQIWRAAVGRISLLLLDTNLEENAPTDRDITDQLYGGDNELRLQQEIVLGIGGMRALHAAGFTPDVCHMNEGHSAFLGLERIRELRLRHGLSFQEAHELARAGIIFTTHTPVEAGHDRFPAELMRHYFAEYAADLGIGMDGLLGLGRESGAAADAPFNMSMLALRLAARANGVSRLHAQVSRRMWRSLWPGLPEAEIPIAGVANGVHFRSWISREMDQLYDRYLGPRWREEPGDSALWQRARQIPAEELWRTHERRRERLIAFVRRHLRQQLARRRSVPSELARAAEILDPEALTIGFARRFAPYKRATLLLRDPDRLAALLEKHDRRAGDRRVQFIFAGKAHPRDHMGKELIQRLVQLTREPPFAGRFVFLEDYDLTIARYMTQGCDVWLNTPRRPLEASGTSGMKALANGVLNVSTIDGWWADAWDRFAREELTPGWSIGNGEEYADPEEQDAVEAVALYDVLERSVLPEFFERTAAGLPRRWIERMQLSLAELCPHFNTHRMVREYTESYYLPSLRQGNQLMADGASRARSLAQWRGHVINHWQDAVIERLEHNGTLPTQTGESLEVHGVVRLGRLSDTDVAVELYVGRVAGAGELVEITRTEMRPIGPPDAGKVRYSAHVKLHQSGRIGYTARVVPRHADLVPAVLEGMVRWAG